MITNEDFMQSLIQARIVDKKRIKLFLPPKPHMRFVITPTLQES